MQVFYVPGQPHAIDYATERDGQTVAHFTGETLAQLAKRYPGVTLGSESEFLEQQSRALRTDPEEITEAAFFEALEVLPPLDWQGGGGAESFKLSEFYAGNVTTIYANAAGRFWKFRDVATLPHRAIMDRIHEHARQA